MKSKLKMIVAASLVFAGSVRASEQIPYFDMPVGVGYAVDIKGVIRPNIYAMRDVTFGPHPQYPYGRQGRDPATWTRELRGFGLYRVELDPATGRVSRIAVVKSAGHPALDEASMATFKQWRFKPGKWKTVDLPTRVTTKWVQMTGSV